MDYVSLYIACKMVDDNQDGFDLLSLGGRIGNKFHFYEVYVY